MQGLLRRETRGRPIVVVGIVDILRVELDLAVVELEVGGLREVAITIWFCPCLSDHQSLRVVPDGNGIPSYFCVTSLKMDSVATQAIKRPSGLPKTKDKQYLLFTATRFHKP